MTVSLQDGVAAALWHAATAAAATPATAAAALRALGALVAAPGSTAALDLLDMHALPELVHRLTQPVGGDAVPGGDAAPVASGALADVQDAVVAVLAAAVGNSADCLEVVRCRNSWLLAAPAFRTTQGYGHKTPFRASFDQRFNRHFQLSPSIRATLAACCACWCPSWRPCWCPCLHVSLRPCLLCLLASWLALCS